MKKIWLLWKVALAFLLILEGLARDINYIVDNQSCPKDIV